MMIRKNALFGDAEDDYYQYREHDKTSSSRPACGDGGRVSSPFGLHESTSLQLDIAHRHRAMNGRQYKIA